MHYGSRVEDLDALDADVVVVTAGSWVGRFFPDLPLKVTRETVAFFRQETIPPSIVELGSCIGLAPAGVTKNRPILSSGPRSYFDYLSASP